MSESAKEPDSRTHWQDGNDSINNHQRHIPEVATAIQPRRQGQRRLTIATAGQPVNFLKDSDDMPTPNDNDDNSEATDDDDSEATNDNDSEATDDDSDASDGDSDATDDNSDATDNNTDATGDNSDATDNAQRRRGAVTTRMGQALY
ncbi:hypothetical protein EDB89DRAFT_2246572 [Lactarius sanguifluus]|nr:hypothetical protein EDB89DRAFT_2246572 [Lactarius sanguifluus]